MSTELMTQHESAGTETEVTIAEGTREFRDDVIRGLRGEQKSLPCKYFYDEAGSRLFEQICEVEEYYVTRVETQILTDSAHAIAAHLPAHCVLIEPGAGNAEKMRFLADAIRPDIYVPIDISGEYLQGEAERLRRQFEDLQIEPIAADFTGDFDLPEHLEKRDDRVLFFPGSTIGNFTPSEATSLLADWRSIVGETGRIVIGVDVAKDSETLEAAYDDQEGVTGRFNLNLLERINRELGADFSVSDFTHRAVHRVDRHRVEMHLVSDRVQQVELDGEVFHFERDESIHTENSHKYPAEVFAEVVSAAGYEIDATFHDANQWFHVHVLRPTP